MSDKVVFTGLVAAGRMRLAAAGDAAFFKRGAAWVFVVVIALLMAMI